ncbi:hypothetical protein Pst134EA_032772 [Puccinia striiformis f. sp. tritici]|uniref:uncharacterized protein n=1 Tax=Puccinia striiformis f. sp. tritici TaxID=168172 RepID=UPI002008347B|nr:uncharacterized protein Pst134EA_032772 [Puccinia striiformis f. sp. tritici]KAH9440736.1 hypothetical protein Pst134EA_032772 [Puccinia striiformis f. sp. tritici]
MKRSSSMMIDRSDDPDPDDPMIRSAIPMIDPQSDDPLIDPIRSIQSIRSDPIRSSSSMRQ